MKVLCCGVYEVFSHKNDIYSGRNVTIVACFWFIDARKPRFDHTRAEFYKLCFFIKPKNWWMISYWWNFWQFARAQRKVVFKSRLCGKVNFHSTSISVPNWKLAGRNNSMTSSSWSLTLSSEMIFPLGWFRRSASFFFILDLSGKTWLSIPFYLSYLSKYHHVFIAIRYNQ